MKKLVLAALLLVPIRAFALDTSELLSLIAMPLAVAAVSEVTGVPTDELSNFVATLNNANVPPTQIVDVLRYVPVALVTDATQQQPVFIDYVQTQVQQGITGAALVPVIVQRLRTYDVQPVVVTQAQQTIVVDSTYIPQPVVTRVTEIRTKPAKVHPHGGPPGQIKKQIGVQTGAEVVHGEKPGKGKQQPMISSAPQPQRMPPQAQPPQGKGKGKGHGKKH